MPRADGRGDGSLSPGRVRPARGLRGPRDLRSDARARRRDRGDEGARSAGGAGPAAARGEPARSRRAARGARVEDLPAPSRRRLRRVRALGRRHGPRGRPDRARSRLLPLAVHLQEPGRMGTAVAPGQLLLPVRARAAGDRRLARRDGGDARERLPARAARVAPRAGPPPRARSPAGRQLRLRRDRGPRHERRRSPC